MSEEQIEGKFLTNVPVSLAFLSKLQYTACKKQILLATTVGTNTQKMKLCNNRTRHSQKLDVFSFRDFGIFGGEMKKKNSAKFCF